ncbi:virulence VirE3 domain-containing protein (plasmid) [Rhizobium etli 8C-3]|uniref:Virulence VirE3 domain-containing protein n=1 Tax=Rhizobium etli 8C-3 TaxID=538025 RepID=A0A1L5PAP5_RHIET|nr:hypothetical protein [Rhizobium etli]APO77150.1 virulence VirE3 domain-containing protein [Rhizobium etli 8C-3]
MPLKKTGMRDKPIKPYFRKKAANRYEARLAIAAFRETLREREVLDHYQPSEKKQKSYDAEMNMFRSLSEKERKEELFSTFWGNRKHYGSAVDPDMLVRVKRRPNGRTYKGIKLTTPTEPGEKPRSYVARLTKQRGNRLIVREFNESGQLVKKTTQRGLHYLDVWQRDTKGRLIQTEFRSPYETRTLSDADEHGKRRLVVQRGKRMDVFERDEETGAMTQLASTGHRLRSDIQTTMSPDRKSATTIVKPHFGRRLKKYQSEFDSMGVEVARQKLDGKGSGALQGSPRIFSGSQLPGKVKILGGGRYMRIERRGFGKPRVEIRALTEEQQQKWRENQQRRQLEEKPLPNPPALDVIGRSQEGEKSLPSMPKVLPKAPEQGRSRGEPKMEQPDVSTFLALAGQSPVRLLSQEKPAPITDKASKASGVTGSGTSTTGGTMPIQNSQPSSFLPQQGKRTMNDLLETIGMRPEPAATMPPESARLPSLFSGAGVAAARDRFPGREDGRQRDSRG